MSSGFVGTPVGWTRPARLRACPDADRFRSRRQCGADGAGALRQARRRDARPRFRHHSGRAVATASATAGRPFGSLRGQYRSGWLSYDEALNTPSGRLPGLTLPAGGRGEGLLVSANVLKASEDKTFPGNRRLDGLAVGAGGLRRRPGQRLPTSAPTGKSSPRDLYEAWTGLLTDGDLATARAATSSCSRSSSSPTGRCHATRCSMASLRRIPSTPTG